MTLSSTTTKVTYNGDSATTDFAISFVFWDGDDLRVILRDANNAETVWTRGTHYTVTGGAGATGTLTVRSTPTDYTPATGETLTIKDYQSETQEDSLPLSGAFPSTVVEKRLDRITRLIQIHSEEIARSILLPETANLSGLTIPEPGAGELVRYNPGGTSLETVAVGDVSTAIDTLLSGLADQDFLRWDNAQSAWVNITPGATGLALFQDTTAAAARAELGLGTAAVVSTGVADGDVPAMDATGYPAANGSRIANLDPDNVTAGIAPRGFIDGLTLSNNTTDAAKDIDIAAGVARDGGDAANMVLSSTLVKQIVASWAVGTDAGGLDGTESVAGTPDANTWYHCWLIRRSDSGVVDVLFSESATAPTMPTNYDQKRRIGAVLTDGAAEIIGFTQFGDEFIWDVRVHDVSNTSPGTSANLSVMSVPTGVVVECLMAAGLEEGASVYFLITGPDQIDSVPSVSNYDLHPTPTNGGPTHTNLSRFTDTSGQIRYRSTDGAVSALHIFSLGWIDPRGRNA